MQCASFQRKTTIKPQIHRQMYLLFMNNPLIEKIKVREKKINNKIEKDRETARERRREGERGRNLDDEN